MRLFYKSNLWLCFIYSTFFHPIGKYTFYLFIGGTVFISEGGSLRYGDETKSFPLCFAHTNKRWFLLDRLFYRTIMQKKKYPCLYHRHHNQFRFWWQDKRTQLLSGFVSLPLFFYEFNCSWYCLYNSFLDMPHSVAAFLMASLLLHPSFI